MLNILAHEVLELRFHPGTSTSLLTKRKPPPLLLPPLVSANLFSNCFSKGMVVEMNSPTTHTEVESTHSNVGMGTGSSSQPKVYSTTAEAIANFKPTHREVISGIAPHVFDERKRRRSQRRASSPSPPYWCDETVVEKRSSPLRGTSVCAWEIEHSIYLSEQPASKHFLIFDAMF